MHPIKILISIILLYYININMLLNTYTLYYVYNHNNKYTRFISCYVMLTAMIELYYVLYIFGIHTLILLIVYYNDISHYAYISYECLRIINIKIKLENKNSYVLELVINIIKKYISLYQYIFATVPNNKYICKISNYIIKINNYFLY